MPRVPRQTNRTKCLGKTEQGKLVMTMLTDHWNSFVQGRGSYSNMELHVGKWVYETYSANLVTIQRFTPAQDHLVVSNNPQEIGLPPILAFKSSKLKLNPSARNQYEIKIKVVNHE